MIEIIQHILERNILGVFSFFILGVLFVILIQNIFFYSIYKDNSYLLYSLYALIIVTDQILIHYEMYYRDVNSKNLPYLFAIHPYLEWLYNSVYFLFVIQFADLHSIKEKVSQWVVRALYLSIFIAFFLLFIDFIFTTKYTEFGFNNIQVPFLILLSIFVYYHLFQLKTVVKKYIILGSLIYTVFSILAFTNEFFPNSNPQLGWGFFYIGIFIENIFFTLGLSVKQKMLINKHNDSQAQLIVQLKKNEDLKNLLNEKLKKEVTRQTSEIINLNEIAETEKRKKIESRLEKEVAELKISSLQSQMNPHFIFNSLNSIELYIIKNDRDNALYFISKFSKLIRKILSASRNKEVTLQEEIETVKLYVNIENIRFKHKIQFTIKIEENLKLKSIRIPPLILQPFIENSLWHGLSAIKGEKKLDIIISSKNEDYVSISIVDNGIGRKKSSEIKNKKIHKKESIGLKLTEERLMSFTKNFNHKHQITYYDLIENKVPLGTMVIIDLPLN